MYHESEAVSPTFDVLQCLGSCTVTGRFFWSSVTPHFGFIYNREGAKEISLVTILCLVEWISFAEIHV